MPPTIAISYVNRLSPETFDEFERIVDVRGLGLQVEAREEDGPSAGMEWLLPTAVIVFISKPYFEAFLKEMGKDHYTLLKSGLKSLCARLVGPDAPKITVVGTHGKVSSSQPYSLLYSLLAEGRGGIKFKLLFQQSASVQEYESTISAFLQFLEEYHSGTLSPVATAELESTRVVGKTLLLAFSSSLGRVQPIDPFAHRSPNVA